ncbi:hypothetical protein [Novosphingobium sp. 9]|uniref:hypothetical protein n=1 Tax=Novosphingobium sp. 9 TaxID=2025349 RepID=UPI0021B61B8B|nr:hypothetical protein [Novosphingobium sp. 9]
MTVAGRLRAYAWRPDPLNRAANGIALLVASSQPTYPLYVLWMTGPGWTVACWTFLSTPFFLWVPPLARCHSLTGRGLLPLAGITNAVIATKALGEASGVGYFLMPCALIAVLGFRRREWPVGLALLCATVAGLLLGTHSGMPLAQFDAHAYTALKRLNGTSASVLSILILWRFIRARLSSASPESPPQPQRP